MLSLSQPKASHAGSRTAFDRCYGSSRRGAAFFYPPSRIGAQPKPRPSRAERGKAGPGLGGMARRPARQVTAVGVGRLGAAAGLQADGLEECGVVGDRAGFARAEDVADGGIFEPGPRVVVERLAQDVSAQQMQLGRALVARILGPAALRSRRVLSRKRPSRGSSSTSVRSTSARKAPPGKRRRCSCRVASAPGRSRSCPGQQAGLLRRGPSRRPECCRRRAGGSRPRRREPAPSASEAAQDCEADPGADQPGRQACRRRR